MSRIFRNIRQGSLKDSKFGRYVLYAVGEIVLVVIGILIAFSISNWSEGRKARKLEEKMLSDIRSALKNNFFQVDLAMGCCRSGASSAKLILDHLKEDKPYHDSLDVHFSTAIQWCTPTLRNAGYESLKSKGLSVVTNDSIRVYLDIYNNDWLDQLAQRQEDYFYGTASPVLVNLFDKVAMRSSMEPFDYETLKESKEFLSILKTSIAYREDQIFWYRLWRSHYENIEKLISEELETF